MTQCVCLSVGSLVFSLPSEARMRRMHRKNTTKPGGFGTGNWTTIHGSESRFSLGFRFTEANVSFDLFLIFNLDSTALVCVCVCVRERDVAVVHYGSNRSL